MGIVDAVAVVIELPCCVNDYVAVEMANEIFGVGGFASAFSSEYADEVTVGSDFHGLSLSAGSIAVTLQLHPNLHHSLPHRGNFQILLVADNT